MKSGVDRGQKVKDQLELLRALRTKLGVGARRSVRARCRAVGPPGSR